MDCSLSLRRRLARLFISLCLVAATAAAATPPEEPLTLIACAPGYPGNTLEAQPTMDALAAALADVVDWPRASIQAEYHETAEGGVTRMQAADAFLALVPLPFLARYGETLQLQPLLTAEPESGAQEVWSLVARKGAVRRAGDLAGWELTGQPGYAPSFVRRHLLAAWGQLPDDVDLTFSSRILSALRRAAAGEQVAVLLDPSQAAALKDLPFGSDLEVVTRSRPLPATAVCAIGAQGDAAQRQALVMALRDLHRSAAGREALSGVRLKRFRDLDSRTSALLNAIAGGRRD